MASLGRTGDSPPVGTNVISASQTDEMELIDISNRDNTGTGVGTKASAAGFSTSTWEVECHDAQGLLESLGEDAVSGYTAVSVTENISVDGAVTFSVTLKEA
jgi:hypothetical protein